MYQYFSTKNKNETWASILICYSTLDSVHPKLIRPLSSSSYSTYLSWSESNCSDDHGYACNPAVNRLPKLFLRGGQSLPPKITQLLRCSRRPRCYDSSHCSRIQVPRFYSPFFLWIQTGKIVIKFHFFVCSEFSKIWSCVACLLFHIVKADQGWGRQEATGWPGIQRRWSKELVLIAFSLLIFFLKLWSFLIFVLVFLTKDGCFFFSFFHFPGYRFYQMQGFLLFWLWFCGCWRDWKTNA